VRGLLQVPIYQGSLPLFPGFLYLPVTTGLDFVAGNFRVRCEGRGGDTTPYLLKWKLILASGLTKAGALSHSAPLLKIVSRLESVKPQ